jgi:hypothetical protein
MEKWFFQRQYFWKQFDIRNQHKILSKTMYWILSKMTFIFHQLFSYPWGTPGIPSQLSPMKSPGSPLKNAKSPGTPCRYSLVSCIFQELPKTSRGLPVVTPWWVAYFRNSLKLPGDSLSLLRGELHISGTP